MPYKSANFFFLLFPLFSASALYNLLSVSTICISSSVTIAHVLLILSSLNKLAIYSNDTLPTLTKPIPISSKDTPNAFLIRFGINISSPSPSTKTTPFEKSRTDRLESKYRSIQSDNFKFFNCKFFFPNSSSP